MRTLRWLGILAGPDTVSTTTGPSQIAALDKALKVVEAELGRYLDIIKE